MNAAAICRQHARRSTTLVFSPSQRYTRKGVICRREYDRFCQLYGEIFAQEHGSKNVADDGRRIAHLIEDWISGQMYCSHESIRKNFLDQLEVTNELPEENPCGKEEWAEGIDWAKCSFGYVY